MGRLSLRIGAIPKHQAQLKPLGVGENTAGNVMLLPEFHITANSGRNVFEGSGSDATTRAPGAYTATRPRIGRANATPTHQRSRNRYRRHAAADVLVPRVAANVRTGSQSCWAPDVEEALLYRIKISVPRRQVLSPCRVADKDS